MSAGATSISEVRGTEGIAATCYFQLLSSFFPSAFPFQGRSRRPPKDAANTVLSYVYTMLTCEMEAVLRSHMFDIGFGFMHCNQQSAPSLALDMIEPFRSGFGNLLTLNILGHNRLNPVCDFEHDEDTGGVYLTRGARSVIFTAGEQALSRYFLPPGANERITLRQAMERQAVSLIEYITDGKDMEFYKLI